MALSLLCAACTGAPPRATPSDDAGVAATVTIAGQVGSIWSVMQLAEGATVCVFEHPEIPCVVTDDSGRYVLEGVPAESELGISFEKPGYMPLVQLVTTGTESWRGLLRVWISPLELGVLFTGSLSVPGSPDLGLASVMSYVPELGPGYWAAGVTAEVEGELAAGPVYTGNLFWILGDRTVLNSGSSLLGNPDGTEVQVRLHTDREDVACRLEARPSGMAGWVGDAPDLLRVPFIGGFDVLAANVPCEGGPRCSFRDAAGRSALPVPLRLRNDSERALRMVRADTRCLDVPADSHPVAPLSEVEILSFVGFAYRLYDADTDELLSDFYVAERLEPDGDPYLVVYPD